MKSLNNQQTAVGQDGSCSDDSNDRRKIQQTQLRSEQEYEKHVETGGESQSHRKCITEGGTERGTEGGLNIGGLKLRFQMCPETN